jgi:hypothetical protein
MDFVDLYEELEALGERVITQRRLIQQVKLEIDEEEEMQQRRLQERSQPMDKMDKEIEEIRRLMLKTTKETVNNRWRLTRGDCSGNINGALQHNIWKPGGDAYSTTTTTTTKEEEQVDSSRVKFGTKEDLNSSSRGAMSRSS